MEEDFAHEELHLVVDATHHMEHMETDEITSGLQKVWVSLYPTNSFCLSTSASRSPEISFGNRTISIV